MLAGGQSLVPMLNLRLARFEHLVDIGRVAELRGIERRNGHVVVGAATRDAVIELDPTVAADVPLLAAVTPYIGHFQIRNRGTIGGSLAHADPAAEYPAVAVALDATFDVAVGRRHRAPCRRPTFFTGVWSTALEADELLTAIDFPVWTGRAGFGVAEFARRHGDFAIAGAVAAVELGRRPRRARPRSPCSAPPARRSRATRRRAGARPASRSAPSMAPSSAELAFADIDDVADDPQVPAAYRRRVGEAMVAEAWRRAVAAGRRTEHADERAGDGGADGERRRRGG